MDVEGKDSAKGKERRERRSKEKEGSKQGKGAEDGSVVDGKEKEKRKRRSRRDREKRRKSRVRAEEGAPVEKDTSPVKEGGQQERSSSGGKRKSSRNSGEGRSRHSKRTRDEGDDLLEERPVPKVARDETVVVKKKEKVFPSDCSEASKTQKRSLEEVVDEAKEESAEVGSPSSKRPRSTREVVVVLRRGRSVTTTPD